jgi:hypothetical protein
MANLLENIACLLWIVLAVNGFINLKKWNKDFSELHDKLERQIEDGEF